MALLQRTACASKHVVADMDTHSEVIAEDCDKHIIQKDDPTANTKRQCLISGTSDR